MTQAPSAERFRLSAHLGYLFADLPLAARFAAARRAGFRAIETPDPYSLSPVEFRSLCERNRLEVAQIAAPNGISGAARKGLAALPGREREFSQAVDQSIVYAKAVGCTLIHPMSGSRAPFERRPEWEVYLSNLAKACATAAGEGMSVIIEAISVYGTRNYFMNSLRRACEAIRQVNAPNLLLSLDSYHAAAMGVHLPSFVINNGATIGHVQVADWPRRDEPGSGQIDFDGMFAALRTAGYQGYVGMEYVPSAKPARRFDWTRSFDAHLEPLAQDTASVGSTG